MNKTRNTLFLFALVLVLVFMSSFNVRTADVAHVDQIIVSYDCVNPTAQDVSFHDGMPVSSVDVIDRHCVVPGVVAPVQTLESMHVTKNVVIDVVKEIVATIVATFTPSPVVDVVATDVVDNTTAAPDVAVTFTATPSPIVVTTTATPIITSTPSPIVVTETPAPVTATPEAHCDNGAGNGDDCTPGNSSGSNQGNGQQTGDQTNQGEQGKGHNKP